MSATIYRKTIDAEDPAMLCDALAAQSGLSKMRIKRAMNLGAVWLEHPGAPARRVRRATTAVKPGDVAILYYDEDILNREAPAAQCLRDMRRYSIWYKPPGLMTQGSRYGDHCSLARQVEIHFKSSRAVLLVHRLDREAAGLVIVTHDRKAAARFSEMLRAGKIEKRYMVWVRGDLRARGGAGCIDLPLDGRPSRTLYEIQEYDTGMDRSRASVRIITGRRHQIRRHFDLIGHPVMGDPRYGRDNKNRSGLSLVAYALTFDCPFGGGSMAQTIAHQTIAP